MNYYRPSQQQKTAGLIRYSCGILFILFTFCYLFFLQGEILAEAQHVYSKGVTTYNLLIGAIITTTVLQAIQRVVVILSRLPSRWHALSYLPSFLLLAVLTSADRETIQHFSFGVWMWLLPLSLVAYCAIVIMLKKLSDASSKESTDIKTQVYPNFIVLFLLILGTGSIPQSSDVFHYELKAERLILHKDYTAALKVGERSLRATPRLTQLRMYALSQQGQLAELLFHYPQYYGSQGLLDVTDTMSTYRVSPRHICQHLGAYAGSTVHSTQRYYQLVLADSLWNQHTADYYLCSLLLDRQLSTFRRELPRYYNLSDTLPHAYDQLPKAYREALLLAGERKAAMQGVLVVNADTLARFSHQPLVADFCAYNQLKAQLKDENERVNKLHREFGNTYWWYYEYGAQAKGEIAQQPLYHVKAKE